MRYAGTVIVGLMGVGGSVLSGPIPVDGAAPGSRAEIGAVAPGSAAAPRDFDGDGHGDLAMATPGPIAVFYGSASGAELEPRWIEPPDGVAPGGPLAAADFDADGFADLALVVAPESDPQVLVVYGAPSGLGADDDTVLSPRDAERARVRALAAADFDGDGFADLAAGLDEPAAVVVFYGSERGVDGSRPASRLLDGAPATGELALGAGDFDGDGFAELVIGLPFAAVGPAGEAGQVLVIRGGPGWLTARTAALVQTATLIDPAEPGDRFGAVLAVGDFDRDGFADLVIGVPGEDEDGAADSGAVQVVYGSAEGLDVRRAQFWSQANPGLSGTVEAGDRFGASLTTGDFDGDGASDLAIGVPGEDLRGLADVGAVNVLYGSSTGLLTNAGPGGQLWAATGSARPLLGTSIGAWAASAGSPASLMLAAPELDAGGALLLRGTSDGLTGDETVDLVEDEPGRDESPIIGGSEGPDS